MSDTKTVSSSTDLLVEQAKDVANMRHSLLHFDKSDPSSARKAIQNVTILRLYHQLERIVKYTELIDKLEDRIYQSIEMKLMNSDPDDEDLYYTLIPIQERLQKMMIESHKLLEPYLELEQLSALEVRTEEDPSTSFTSMILDQESRERVRTGVQEIMAVLDTVDERPKDTSAVQSKAQEALAELESGS